MTHLLNRAIGLAAALAVCAAFGASLNAQEPARTNTVGMELVLIQPGTMIVGVFEPPYPKPPDPNAPAQPAAGRGGVGSTLAPAMLAAGDRNQDQRLSREELSALVSGWFARLDPGNGKVSQQDFVQGFNALIAPPQAAADAGGGRGGGGRGAAGRGGVGTNLFTVVDVNKDGAVTREEFEAAFDKWFTAWDAAKAGSLSLDQLAAGLNVAVPQPAVASRGIPLTPAEYQRAEAMAKADYMKGFEVRIARPYYIGKYEVTQAQWKRVMGSNPSIFQGDKVTDDADKHPVENVTWADAQAFIKKLNALEKTKAYRLPTEFEWEYAARAGGDAVTSSTVFREQAIAGYNSYTSTHMVGEKKPNAWGLYDMLGNVWEWVQDYYNEKIFADPVPPRTGKEHVLKGGGFVSDVKNTIPATHGAGPGSKFDVGFRIVREVN